MDRRGSAADHCQPIDADAPRTPMWRGLTLVQEMRAAGINVAAASDNVRDWWHPYGDYDPIAIWHAALTIGQLDTAPSEGAWADLVSDSGALALGVVAEGDARGGGSSIAVGMPADLILLPSSRRMSELLGRPHQADRIVLRGGVPQVSALPSYAELDDLVAQPTVRSDPESVQRGATAEAGMPS